jgi:hypothetical protein
MMMMMMMRQHGDRGRVPSAWQLLRAQLTTNVSGAL